MLLKLFDQTTLECRPADHTAVQYRVLPLVLTTLAKKFHLPIYCGVWFCALRRWNCGYVSWSGQSGSFGEIQKRHLWSDWNKALAKSSLTRISTDCPTTIKLMLSWSKPFSIVWKWTWDYQLYKWQANNQEYIYGSAEVVGLMCLKIFVEGDQAMYDRLREPACKLGAAFQKVNFLRDIKSDFEERGRVTSPGWILKLSTNQPKSWLKKIFKKTSMIR